MMTANGAGPDYRTEVTGPVVAVVHQGAIKPIMRLAVRYAFVALINVAGFVNFDSVSYVISRRIALSHWILARHLDPSHSIVKVMGFEI